MNIHGNPRSPETVLKSIATMKEVTYCPNCVWKNTYSEGAEGDLAHGLRMASHATRITTDISARFASATTTFTALKKKGQMKGWK
jgi:hypothetical protein